MGDERLAALLSELLSDEEDDSPLAEKTDHHAKESFDFETSLFAEHELEAAVSSLTETETLTPRQSANQTEPAHSQEQRMGLDDAQGVNNASEDRPSTREKSDLDNGVETDTACGATIENYVDLIDEERSVRRVVSADADIRGMTILDRIREVLVAAESNWNPEGRPDASGGMVGGCIALRVSSAADPLSKALQNQARYGTASVICERPLHGNAMATAVGTSRGLLIVQMQTIVAQGVSNCELFELTEARGNSSITALAFSHHSDKDKLLLAAGNESGGVNVWDISGRKCIVNITGHVGSVHCLEFLPGKSQCSLISSAENGGMFLHTLTSWVVRTAVSTKILSEGNNQPLVFSFFPVARTPDSGEDGTGSWTEVPLSVVAEGMVSLCHPNICNIGRLCMDGRLVVFYQIAKPAQITEDVMPIAVWAPFSTNLTYARHQNPDINGRIPYGVVAVVWGTHLSLLQIPLLGDTQSESPMAKSTSRVMDVVDWSRLAHELHINSIASWETDAEGQILHVLWLSSDRLGVLRRRGILSQFLMFDTRLQIIDKVEIDDSPIACRLRSEPTELYMYRNSFAITGYRMTVLGSITLKWCRQLEWTESASILISIEKWMMAMHLLVAMSCQATGQAYTTESIGRAQLGTKDISSIRQRLAAVLIHFLDWRLNSGQQETCTIDISVAAGLVVDVCVFSEQTELLFHEVFSRFLAADAKDIFLEKLERSLTSNELKARLPPEVMQSLVEYCCEIGKPEKVERCVLQMDISSLDLNQVIPLCIRHHLFTALLAIFNNSLLRDCVTPAKYLVNAIYQAEEESQRAEYSTKLLFYLRCCLFGESFPPGREQIDTERALLTKQQIIGFLLFTTVADLQKVSMKTAVVEGDGHEGLETYPVFRCVLRSNADLVLRMLKDTLQDWECMEKDLLEVFNGGAVEEMPSVQSVTQVIVDALIDMLQDFSESRDVCMDFLSHCAASGRAVVTASTALLLLEHLSAKKKETESYGESEEELQFYGIVHSVGVELDPSKRSPMVMSQIEGQKALGLALNANMLTAAAQLYHVVGDYQSALEHHIKAGKSSFVGCFFYFESSVAHFVEFRKTKELDRLKKAVLQCMGDLAELNPDSAASMVMRHFPNDQEAVIQGLQGTSDLLYKYLKSSMDAALNDSEVTLSTNSDQLLTKPHCTLYVRLMAEYDADNVLPFLTTYDHLVDVQQCKKDCLSLGLKNAAAHLLEREGDVFGALDVLIEKIQQADEVMEKAILSRSLDSLDMSLAHQMSLSAIVRVASTSDTRSDHRLPREISTARMALSGAIKLCRRNSLDRDRQSSGDEHRRQETMRLWFSLLETYMKTCQQLSEEKTNHKKSSHVPPGFYQKGIIKKNDQFQDYPRLAFLRDIYAALIDEVVTAMADYVALTNIADRIISQYGDGRFGDFRSTLLSLIHSYNYEQSILTSIGRLLSADAYRTLVACYKRRVRALPNADSTAAAQ